MISKFLLSAFFFGCLLIQRAFNICPSEEFILPCSCRTMAFGNHIVCNAINSTDLLKDIFRILSNYEIHTLLLYSMRLDGQPLPADIFNGLQVQELRFEDSVFEIEVGNGNLPFQGLENYMNALHVSNCNIIRLDDITFTHLVHLREVTMKFDSMEHIGSDWFKDGPVSVKVIRMDHNMLGTIERGAFLGLRNIETLSLADNKLQTFRRNVLPMNAAKLSWIDLSYNQLEELPTDIFLNMPRLKRVVLTGNKLTSFPQNTWGHIWNKLDIVLFKDNPIVCDSEIRWAFHGSARPDLNGSCKSPKELTGMHLNTLTVDQLPSR